MNDRKLNTPDHIKDYIAPRGMPKHSTANPCAICGWGHDQTIHTNPQLIGRGGPYHEFVAKSEIGKAMQG